MNINMDGKRVKTIIFPGDIELTRTIEKTLTLSATCHGDRDEFWIIECIEGVETARHNCRLIESILWEDLFCNN